MATTYSAPTSSTAAATSRWGAPGIISTSPLSCARKSGRTRRRATPKPRRTSGGTGTTTTTPRPRLTQNGWRYPTLEKPPTESAMQRQNRAKDGQRLHRIPAASLFTQELRECFRWLHGAQPREDLGG